MSSSFQLSPGVRITERDMTNIIPAVATSPAAHAGYAEWGQVLQPTQFSSEDEFVAAFGKPNLNTFTSFFTVANFLAYSSNILFTRAASTAQYNAANAAADIAGAGTVTSVAGSTAVTGASTPNWDPEAIVGKYLIAPNNVIIGQISSVQSDTALTLVEPAHVTVTTSAYTYGFRTTVNNKTVYDTNTVDLSDSGEFIAKFPGAKGNGLGVYVADSSTWSMTGVGTVRSAKNVAMTSVARTSNVVTITTPNAHNLLAGQVVKITGLPGFNGVHTVITPATYTFTFAQTGADLVSTSAIGGLVNSKQLSGSGTTFSVDTQFQVGNYIANSAGVILGRIQSVDSTVLITLEQYPPVTSDSAFTVKWKYFKDFDSAPSTSAYAAQVGGLYDDIHVVVADDAGLFSGVAGTVLERYPFLSKASNARSSTGATQYYVDVINNTSKYIWWANAPSGMTNWGSVANATTFNRLTYPLTVILSKGANGAISTEGQIMEAFDLYANAELYDISLLLGGKTTYDLANHLIQNIAEVRKDCVAFISPQSVVTDEYVVGATSEATYALKDFADLITSSSYGFIDSGAKYQYDLYNDTYRWLPLNGDIGGITARTDNTNDPWWSPAGYNRGQVKNIIKLGFNPHNRTDRDVLYQARINPVLTERGQGTLLFGDKTALAKPSAFDRINVRRLFIVLEKSIAIAAKYMLFEFNDATTRNLFIGMVLPFLRDVQGRRGIQSFKVVCDETNNTNEVIASNNFVADIYIQPNYSINFITLNFVATRSGAASFTEV